MVPWPAPPPAFQDRVRTVVWSFRLWAHSDAAVPERGTYVLFRGGLGRTPVVAGRPGIPARFLALWRGNRGADRGTRTRTLLFTNPLAPRPHRAGQCRRVVGFPGVATESERAVSRRDRRPAAVVAHDPGGPRRGTARPCRSPERGRVAPASRHLFCHRCSIATRMRSWGVI